MAAAPRAVADFDFRRERDGTPKTIPWPRKKSQYEGFVPFFDQGRNFSADQVCKCE
jgi:hypothetical protein